MLSQSLNNKLLTSFYTKETCVVLPVLFHMSDMLHLLTTTNRCDKVQLTVSPATITKINNQQGAAEDCVRVTSAHFPRRENFSSTSISTGMWIPTANK